MDLLTTPLLTLRPAILQDKKKIFNWLTNSNMTREMMGPPEYPDSPVPSWTEFDMDYSDQYFDPSDPRAGQCYLIIHNDLEIGQINHNEIRHDLKCTELDIWMADRKYTGKGYGSSALKSLCFYLLKNFDCKTFYIAPSRRNTRAIRAYHKAGFKIAESIPDHFIPDYHDTVLMVKYLEN